MTLGPETNGEEFAFGRWRLLPASRRLLADGAPIVLGSRAFDVLLALVEAGGQLVTKDDLMRRVWLGTIVDENNIQVQISALRKALGADGQRLIATIPGRGYRFTGQLSGRAMPAPSASEAPSGPSIAVLPFQNMSGDPEQEYFVDGMVEEITTALSRIRWLFVASRNSSFVYKAPAVDVQRVGRELGVRYVLEGSIRKAGERVRITAQLIDAVSGAHLWADRFDGALEDVFDLQDRVASNVAGVIEPPCRPPKWRGPRTARLPI